MIVSFSKYKNLYFNENDAYLEKLDNVSTILINDDLTVFTNEINGIDKLNLGMNLNYEELEYTKKMWLKYNLDFPLLTRIEFRIFEKMRCLYERSKSKKDN